jgi:hypothetical protein
MSVILSHDSRTPGGGTRQLAGRTAVTRRQLQNSTKPVSIRSFWNDALPVISLAVLTGLVVYLVLRM